ncbi:DUF2124 domain-containing protein [Methanolobus halotolerans]|uniref:DUF2124 domain-containing protein n=1 Tax=Methanolobus halotolerans TaxID=2052935 RepID=A0A4E0PZ42_9EURY|nr:DUF2124 domain-containing protein [Methanolobus halotolerans]TGC09120.1 DUF2124 domain-containing protein [Methanolobus halotolerans]
MKAINTTQGIGGQLTEFRKLVEKSEKITFVGTAGFCTPFAELMAFVLRKSDKQMTFIPDLKFEEARSIISTSHGMQVGDSADPRADTVVLLGGLAMPKTGIEAGKMKEMTDRILDGSGRRLIIGICFQSIFQKMDWPDFIDFDYIIDADMTNQVLKI